MKQSGNSLSDVAGLKVGHAHDAAICSGVSVILPDSAAVASVDIRGGSPGSRECDAISGRGLVEHVHGIVLSGGSAYGLSAAGAVQQFCAAQRKGFRVGDAVVPIVPQLILFDLVNGGSDSACEPERYVELAAAACRSASKDDAACGSVGAGFGATTATLRGGLGQASAVLSDGTTVAALVAVNAVGSVTVGDGPHFWAAPFERDGEFGGFGLPASLGDVRAHLADPPLKGEDRRLGEAAGISNTTIGVVATDAALDQRACGRLAAMAHAGLARAIHPVHTLLDGDGIFALATGARAFDGEPYTLARIGSAAADCMARAVARAVHAADPAPEGWKGPPAWREKWGARVNAKP